MADKPTPNRALAKMMASLMPVYILTILLALLAGMWCILLAPLTHSWIALAGGVALLLYGSHGVGLFLETARTGAAAAASQSLLGALSAMAHRSESEETH